MEAMVTVDVTLDKWLNAIQMAAVALPVKVVTRQLRIMATESFIEGIVTALMAHDR